jgi:hypothetical protein
MFALPWGQNRCPEDYKFHNFGRGLLALIHHAFSFSSTCAVVEKKTFNKRPMGHIAHLSNTGSYENIF